MLPRRWKREAARCCTPATRALWRRRLKANAIACRLSRSAPSPPAECRSACGFCGGAERLAASSLRCRALLLGCAIRLFEDRGERAIRQLRVEVDAYPAANSDIGRHEEMLRIGGDQVLLRARRRVAPDSDAAVAVVIVRKHR